MRAPNSIAKALTACAIVVSIVSCSKEKNPTAITTGWISGRITDIAGGNPISGATITTQPATDSTMTDAHGHYSLPNIPTASYSIAAAKVGYFSSMIHLRVEGGDTVIANILLATKMEGHQAGEEREFPLGDTTITMVWIPAGSFLMGSPAGERDRDSSEGPVHQVTIANGFWMGKYEMTQGLWVAVMGFNPSEGHGVGADYPVYNTSWDDVQAFALRLGGIFRLPSESEREYASRAGTATRFYWGDDSAYSDIGNHAWYVGNSGGSTHPVGGKGSNAWGLFDMSGNVWEWTEDWFHDNYTSAPADGKSWISPSGTDRVMRGGSWKCPVAEYSRSARRLWRSPALRDNYIGFRLVCGGGY